MECDRNKEMRIICDEKKNEKSDVCDDDDGGDRPFCSTLRFCFVDLYVFPLCVIEITLFFFSSFSFALLCFLSRLLFSILVIS